MSTHASTNETLNSFSFGATIKTREEAIGLDALGETFPSVNSITLVSREFFSYEECISSCKKLMDDVLVKINNTDKYKLGSEVNPVYSGTATLSKDWEIGEVSRIWIYDKSMEKSGQIQAIGQARVFGALRRPDDTLN